MLISILRNSSKEIRIKLHAEKRKEKYPADPKRKKNKNMTLKIAREKEPALVDSSRWSAMADYLVTKNV